MQVLKLIGFNAISADTSVMKMARTNDGPIKLQFNAMSAEVDENDNIVLSIPSYYSSSYMLCASATLNPTGQHTILNYNGRNLPNTVFGSDNVLTYYPGLSINSSETWNAGVALNNSIARNGIAINNSKNTSEFEPGISLNNSTATLCNFAINNSVTHYTANTVFQFAANDAQVSNYGFALNGSVNDHSIAIGTPAFTSDNHSLAYSNSIVSDHSVSVLNSTAVDHSISLYKSTATHSAVSLFDSSAAYDSLTLYNSYTLVDDTTGHNIAAYNSTVSGNSLCLYNGHATDYSLAIFDSVAINNCFAFNNSTATTYLPGSLSLMSSVGTRNDSFAFCRSTASNPYSLVFNSQYSDQYGISFVNSVGAHSQAIALYNTTAIGTTDSRSFDAYNMTYSVPTVRNISSYISDDITLHNSKIGYTTVYFPANVFTGYSCGSIPNGSATSGKYHIEHTMTKYNSFNAGNDSISYYSSTVGVGVSAALAMYDSVVKTDAMILTPNGQDSTFTSLTNCNIAMYDSTITSGDNEIVLWNNKVKIEERGSINDTIFIDMNIKSNVSKPEYSVLNGINQADADSKYYVGKHIFIIA